MYGIVNKDSLTQVLKGGKRDEIYKAIRTWISSDNWPLLNDIMDDITKDSR